jgi:hypothetical protein
VAFVAVNAFVCTNFDMIKPIVEWYNSLTFVAKFSDYLVVCTSFEMVMKSFC